MVADRRGEAHLWLLLEEALVAVRRGGSDVWDVRRNFVAVAQALAATGLVPAAVARALGGELDDALALRRLLEPSAFTARPFPFDDAAAGAEPVSGGVAVWLEAEVERHLELVSAFDPATRPDAGASALRVLGGPVRAFESAGALGSARRLVDDLAASLASAGFDTGRVRPGSEGRVRREWVRYLRERPSSAPGAAPPQVRVPRIALGELSGRVVRVDHVGWTATEIDVRVTARSATGPGREDWTPWHARVLDRRGRLHLGPPTTSLFDGGSRAHFRLRPGLPADADRVDLRITAGAARVEGTVLL